ncbi:MAG: hypothetical protein JNL82_04040 [Myxococcales bacterium]|nr:hypothetical protein [Myxococcales bacterium]
MPMRRTLSLGLSLALAPGAAAAQEPGPIAAAAAPAAAPVAALTGLQDMSPGPAVDTVLLHGGGLIRGTVAEAFPGRHVVIVSAAGMQHTIAWDQVLDVRYGGAAGPTAGAPAQGPGRPRLHIELTRPATVRLYEMTGTIVVPAGSAWTANGAGGAVAARPVCMAPCDEVIDGSGGQSFFFGGDRMMPSRKFTLREHDGDMTAVVRPGRMGVWVGGLLLTSTGLAPLLAGAVFVAVPRSSSSSSNLRPTGAVLLGVGAGMLISGALMLALGRTRVELYKRTTGASERRAGLARR